MRPLQTSPCLNAEGLLLKQIAHREITITTTRFIDDLTFSGRAGNEEALIATVIGVFKAYGFEINRKKLKKNGELKEEEALKVFAAQT